MHEAVIVSAARTAIGDARKGALANVPVHDLAKASVVESLKRSGVPADDVDDLVLGEVLQGGGCIARYVAVDAGLPADLPGLAVNRQCASGLSALNAAAAGIMAGMERVVIAGGVASMTQAPAVYLKSALPHGEMTRWTSPSHPDTPEAPNMNMGITVGENTAEQCGITRHDQDAWAYRSHVRAVAATDDGRFAEEIVPVQVPGSRGEAEVFAIDEHPRRDTSMEKLATLRPYYKPDGTVTAGNSSSLNDGSAALVLCAGEYAAAHGLEPLAVVRSWASVGVPPRETGIAPSIAIPRALERAGLSISDLSLVEINEAFASMAVACTRLLGLDEEIVNVNGGAVGLGHPVACSGARIVVTLIHELRRRGGGMGVASLCAGGGMGAATVLEVRPA